MASSMLRSSIGVCGASRSFASIPSFSPSALSSLPPTASASLLPLRSFSSSIRPISRSSSSSSFRSSFSFPSSFSSSSSSLLLSSRRYASTKTDAVTTTTVVSSPPSTPAAVPADATSTVSSIDVQSLASASETVTSAATVVADHWWNVNAAHSLLESFHTWLGAPWWATIIITTISIRTLMVPLLINQNRFTARMGNMREELEAFNAETQAMRAKGSISQEQASNRTRQMKQMMQKHGVKFSHIFIYPAVSMPVFATFFFALRSMHEKCPDFVTGGMYWFMDLSASDPTYALPIITGLSMLAMTELSSEFAGAQMDPNMAKTQKNVMRFFSILVIPAMGSTVPAGVYLYWTASNLFSVVASYFITRPWMKKLLNIPPPNPKKVETVQSKLLKSIENDKFVGQPEDSVMGKLGLAKRQPEAFVPYIPHRKIKTAETEAKKQ